MSINSILTNFKSGSTIVRADFLNSFYGGLYDTEAGSNYDPLNPLVAGHIHDGLHGDGHAQKINLVNHVTGQITNINIGSNEINTRNIASYINKSLAIPERDGSRYYLDLSELRDEFTESNPFIVKNYGIISAKQKYDGYSFIFGSPTMNDNEELGNFSRMFFDKDMGAFRAGYADGRQWNYTLRGKNTASFGKNNIVDGKSSTVAGGEDNTIELATASGIFAGKENNILGRGRENNFIGSGNNNSILDGDSVAIVSGENNKISKNTKSSLIGSGRYNSIDSSSNSIIAGGSSNSIESSKACTIISGIENNITSDSKSSVIVSGGLYEMEDSKGNVISSSMLSGIFSGSGNLIEEGTLDILLGGISNYISSSIDKGKNSIVSGSSNSIFESSYSTIVSGKENSINSDNSFVGSGYKNDISGKYSSILNGHSNKISGSNSTIVGGKKNEIESSYAVIGGGVFNEITDDEDSMGDYSVVSGGEYNIINSQYGSIGGGNSNVVRGEFGTIPGGNNNIASGHASIASGSCASATSYGQRSHSSGGFESLAGSSQEVTYIFRGSAQNSENNINLFLDGESAQAIISSYANLYLTCELLIVGAYTYGVKTTILIHNDGTNTTSTISTKYQQINPLSIPPWDISVVSSSESWYINISTTENSSDIIRATCICRGVMLIGDSAPLIPSPTFTSDITSGVAPLTVRFLDTSKNEPTSWDWDFGNDGTSSAKNPRYTYEKPGTYTVQLTATNSSGSNQVSKTNYIQVDTPPAPKANFEASPRVGYAPLTVKFRDASGGNPRRWDWYFKNKGSADSSDINPEYTYDTPGEYNVRLEVSNPYGSESIVRGNSEVKYIKVLSSQPKADFTVSKERVYVGRFIRFTNKSTGRGLTYNWDFGDGTSSTAENPRKLYLQEGKYDVVLTVTNDISQSDSANIGIVVTNSDEDINIDPVTPLPTAQFTSDIISGVAPLEVNFQDTTTNQPTSWNWNFGDGETSEEQDPNHIYNEPGTYTVQLTAANSSGSSNEIKTSYIQVDNPPAPKANFRVVNLGEPVTGFAPLTVIFEDLTVGQVNSWDWDFGDGGTSSLQNPTYTYQTPGSFNVTLSVAGNGGNSKVKRGTLKNKYINILNTEAMAGAVVSADEIEADEVVRITDNSSGDIVSQETQWPDGEITYERNPSRNIGGLPGPRNMIHTVTSSDGSSSSVTISVNRI